MDTIVAQFLAIMLGYVSIVFCVYMLLRSQFHIQYEVGYYGLDILRGVLAYCVYVGHSVLMSNLLINKPWWPPAENYKYANLLGVFGVDTFFTITGYLFAIYKSKWLSFLFFYKSRLKRIYFPYIVAVLLIILFICLNGGYLNSQLIYLFLMATSKLNTDITPYYAPLYFHFWTLKLELIFYFLLPFIYFLENRVFRYSYVVILLIVTIFLDYHFLFILAGYFFARELSGWQIKIIDKFAILVIAALAILSMFYFTDRYSLLIARIFVSISIVLFFKCLEIRSSFFRFSKPFVALGKVSYSLYLIHGLSLVVATISLDYIGYPVDNITFSIAAQIFLIPLLYIVFMIGEYQYFKNKAIK